MIMLGRSALSSADVYRLDSLPYNQKGGQALKLMSYCET